MTAPVPTRAEEARTGESGRTMRIMLSDELKRRVKRGERVVIVPAVPWELFGEAGERASQNNHGQSLNRISERGGFSAPEAVCVLTGMSWKKGGSITEEQGHRILYAMAAFYRRGGLAARDASARAEAEVARLTAENKRLRIAFHDATRRPLGVTPDSGAEFYDQRMADEAEERRRAGYPQEVITRIGRAEAAARAALHGGENDR